MGYFVLEDDIKKIQRFVNRCKIAISFREAGDTTLLRLASGCACKGHEILEKSIRESRLKAAKLPKNLTRNAAKLEGLIGHWYYEEDDFKEEHPTLLGVYLSEYGVHNFVRLTQGMIPVEQNIASLCDALIDVADMTGKAYSKTIAQCFLTGDYDVHDILYLEARSGNDHIVHENEEKEILMALNHELHPENADLGELTNERHVIRHGAQINYPIFMFEHEYGKPLVLPVIKADNHIMMFTANEESVEFALNEDLKTWYQRHNIAIKSTFDEDELSKAYALSMWFQSCYKTIKKAVLDFEALATTGLIEKKGRLIVFNEAEESGIAKKVNTFYQQLVNQQLITHDVDIKDIKWKDMYKNNTLDKYKGIKMSERQMGDEFVDAARGFIIMLRLDNRTKSL